MSTSQVGLHVCVLQKSSKGRQNSWLCSRDPAVQRNYYEHLTVILNCAEPTCTLSSSLETSHRDSDDLTNTTFIVASSHCVKFIHVVPRHFYKANEDVNPVTMILTRALTQATQSRVQHTNPGLCSISAWVPQATNFNLPLGELQNLLFP